MRGGRRRLFTDSQCAELWRMYKAGESILGIGRALDRGSSAVRRVLESTGGRYLTSHKATLCEGTELC
jgi:hypothetical protein